MDKSDKNIRILEPKKKVNKNSEKPIQKYRFLVQSLFTLLCVWIGVEFYFFIQYLESGGAASYSSRPPGVDGFLPISSLMSFYLFLTTGEIHSAHPAGLFIFSAIVLVSLVFGKSFCSWLCPVGFLSELVGDFGQQLIKNIKKFFRKFGYQGSSKKKSGYRSAQHLPKWLDYPLRSLKYLMLGFLFYSVFFLMTGAALQAFLDSPYNLVADIKMYYFFADISRFSLIVIAALFILSIFIRNFWCRFLCPYGALLGAFSFLSPNKIKRNPVSCIDCGLCAKACPSNIKVDKLLTVLSDECTSCFNCIDACPVADTLELKTVIVNKKVSKKTAAIAIASIFMMVTGIGIATGNWQNNISKEEYLIHYNFMNSYGHPTGTEAVKKFNDQVKTNSNENNTIDKNK